jgi:hypothetical protein
MNATTDIERMRDYLADRLPAAERQAFEGQLERTPQLVAELELALRLREGLARLSERGQLESLVSGRQRHRWPWIATAVAATIAGLAVSFWAWQARPIPTLSASLVRYGVASRDAGIIAARFTFRAMRGAAPAPLLDLPGSGAIELMVAPSSADSGARYALALERIAGDGSRSEVGQIGRAHV